MSGEYEPTLMDVAKLLYATSGQGPSPEVLCLVDWLIDQVPEVQELWKTVNQPLGGGVTFLDVMDLHFCLHHEQKSEKAYGLAAIARKRPVLEDKLPVLVHVLASKDNRESLSHALAELAAALHTVERATAESTPA